MSTTESVKDRVRVKKVELDARLATLDAFILDDPKFLTLDAAEQERLRRESASLALAVDAAEKQMEGVPTPIEPATIVWPDEPVGEREIQAAGADRAPRVTADDMQAEIAGEHYFTAADGAFAADDGPHSAVSNRRNIPESLGLLTICVLILRNGFTVVGTSACASPENFNAELGRQVAREKAVDQLWQLLGFRLKDKLAAAKDQSC